jgi:hypothetical protein
MTVGALSDIAVVMAKKVRNVDTTLIVERDETQLNVFYPVLGSVEQQALAIGEMAGEDEDVQTVQDLISDLSGEFSSMIRDHVSKNEKKLKRSVSKQATVDKIIERWNHLKTSSLAKTNSGQQMKTQNQQSLLSFYSFK